MNNHDIYIDWELSGPNPYRPLLTRVITAALAAEGVALPCEISVLLTDDAGIRQINADMRNIDRATDVLSFPMFDLTPGQPPEDEEDLDPETGLCPLGDMCISLERAAAQARDLAEAGYRELVLTGIELSAYGRDLPERPGLAALIAQVCRAVPGMRVRLGSLEPRTVTEDFCAQLAGLPNLCPHFHLSLQSGCDATLARMKRRYTTERYLESVELLRRHFDRPALTTDLIVGFPGETEGEFAQTLSFLQTCAFAQMHIFPYSRRQGTPAAGMPGQIPNGEKARRAHQGAELARAMEKSWLSSWMGQRVAVLFEEEKDGFWRGYTPQYIEVRGKGENLHNRVCPVTLTAVGEGVAFGVVTEEEAP